MKLPTLKSTLVIFGVVAGAVAFPRPAAAQFLVHDPVNLLALIKQLASEVQNGATLAQQLQTGLKLYNNAVQLYGVASQEASFLKNKQILLAAGFLAQNAMIPGQPGWDKALTTAGGIAGAGAAWKQMTAPGGSLQNRIKMADSFAASMLNSVGSCNAAAAQSDGSLGKLEQMAADLSPAANSRANQANLGNMASTQQLRVQECQHNLQLQQAGAA
jgi:hypothetical protein